MSFIPKSENAGYRMVHIIGFVAVLVSLIGYLIVSYALSQIPPDQVVAGNEMAFYILLLLAFLFPAWLFVWEKITIKTLRKDSLEVRRQQRRWVTVAILRIAVVDACFVFGLAAVMMTRELERIWIFFAIGAAWAIVWWPTPARIKTIIEKVEAP